MKTLNEKIAQKAAQAIVDAVGVMSIDHALDVLVQEINDSAEVEEAQIWIGPNSRNVAVNILDWPEPIVVPFFVPEPNLPVRASATAQVDECKSEIAELRKFASDLLSMADESQRKLDEILNG